MPMTPEEIEVIATKVARKTVSEVFLTMGINASDPGATVRFQKDLIYLREAREGKDEFISKGKWAVMAVFVSGALAMLWKGFTMTVGGN